MTVNDLKAVYEYPILFEIASVLRYRIRLESKNMLIIGENTEEVITYAEQMCKAIPRSKVMKNPKKILIMGENGEIIATYYLVTMREITSSTSRLVEEKLKGLNYGKVLFI